MPQQKELWTHPRTTELEAARSWGKMPHEWDRAPRWAKAEATAHYIIMRQLEHWANLSEEERKRMLSKAPRVEHG